MSDEAAPVVKEEKPAPPVVPVSREVKGPGDSTYQTREVGKKRTK